MKKILYTLGVSAAIAVAALALFPKSNATRSAKPTRAVEQTPAAIRATEKGISEYIDTSWAKNKLWDDGKAEVNTYEATRTIYGKARSFDYTHVVVKEVFNEAFNVKTDDYDRADLFEVMKVNKFARIPTDNYPYHFMTSVFALRDQPDKVHKFVNSSQEWCGQTYKQFDASKKGYIFSYQSYWDGQGSGQHEYKDDFWFEDQLSYTLRTLKFVDGLTFKRQVLPLQITSKARIDRPVKADFTVSKAEEGWKVTVDMQGRTNEYWFEAEYPNKLLRQETWDGRSLKLKESSRYAYWRG